MKNCLRTFTGLVGCRTHCVSMIAVYSIFLISMTGCKKIKELTRSVEKKFTSTSSTTQTTSDSDLSYFQVKRTDIVDSVEVDGKLQASERIDLVADKRMRISPAKFKVADRVKRGAVLFTVDTKEFELKKTEAKERVSQLTVDIKSAEAQLALAAKQVERKKGLVAKGIAAQKELEELEKAFVIADTDLKSKQLELRKSERELATANETVQAANLVSPIDGIVSTIVTGGEEVNQGQSLARIENPAFLALVVSLSEAEVTRFKVGQSVAIDVEAVPQPLQGLVKEIEAISQQGAAINSYNVSISLDAAAVKSLGLRNGYSAKLRAVFSKKENALAVPKSCLKRNGSENYVLVSARKGQTPAARAVKIGMQSDLEVEITQGLKEGEYVATSSSVDKPNL